MHGSSHYNLRRGQLASGGASEKQPPAQQQQENEDHQGKAKRQKRASDAPQPMTRGQGKARKARKSAPSAMAVPLLAGCRQASATPVGANYNLRPRMSLPPAAGRPTDGSLPAAPAGGLEGSAVRPRLPKQIATFSELPLRALKLVCQHLDQASLVHARAATPDLREACSEAPVALRLTLPMQSAPWLPVQYRTWDMRLRGLAGLLSSGKMTSTELQLRMEGAANWRAEEAIPPAQLAATVRNLLPMLARLTHLSELGPKSPILHADVELPVTYETLGLLASLLLEVTSLRLDSLIPPPHNHVAALVEVGAGAFQKLRKLDIAVTAWDQVALIGGLTQLTDLSIGYKMWNIPELTPLTALHRLETFNFEVQDDRARFQLDFLSPCRHLPFLRSLRAAIIASRTAVDPASSLGSCEWLSDCEELEELTLDLRVPPDAAQTAHLQLRSLYTAPPACKVSVTIRADALPREVAFESAASRGGTILVPRLGCAFPPGPEARDRWGCLDMGAGGHEPGLLGLHLRGYGGRLAGLPDLSGAHLTRLQISHARLSLSDFVALASCTTLEHLHVCFSYAGPRPLPFSISPTTQPHQLAAAEALAVTASRLVAPEGQHTMVTRLRRKSSLSTATGGSQHTAGGGAGTGGGAVGSGTAHVCVVHPPPIVLSPLVMLRKLQSLEVVEVEDEIRAAEMRLAAAEAAGTGGGAGPSGVLRPRSARSASVGASGPATRTRAASARASGGGAGAARRSVEPAEAGAGAAAAAGATASGSKGPAASAAGAGPGASRQAGPHMPLSRSGLRQFLRQLAAMPELTSLHLSLLRPDGEQPADGGAGDAGPSGSAPAVAAQPPPLPDCGCLRSCFAAADKRPPPRMDVVEISGCLGRSRVLETYCVSLGAPLQGGRVSSGVMGGAVGGGVVASSVFGEWLRPSAWPQLEDGGEGSGAGPGDAGGATGR